MPRVWAGRRRWLLVLLGLLGVFQAAMALLMAFTVERLLGQPAEVNQALRSGRMPDGTPVDPAAAEAIGTYLPTADLILLAVAVLTLGGARWAERVVAEDLGQDYVFEQRRRLIGSSLTGGRGSLGVVLTRASNDLTAVRNWISQGMVPLVTALPLILVVVVVLALASPLVGAAVGAPVLLLALLMPPLAQATYRRSRELRRRRGRMSARISDSVRARDAVVAAGGVQRELNAVDRDSGKVVHAAVSRAQLTGLVRALALTAASLSTAGVVTLGALGVVDAAAVASALTLVGVMSGPVGELGRVVEYRQNYRAARRVQAPLLRHADRAKAEERRRRRAWEGASQRLELTGPGGVVVDRLTVQGRTAAPLRAHAGDCVLLHSADPARVQVALEELVNGHHLVPMEEEEQPTLRLWVDGWDLGQAPAKERRRLLGHASARVPLERGSIARSVAYRYPESDEEDVLQALERVALLDEVEELPRGVKTRLREGGRPLTRSQQARLKLGRALMEDPPLLVLEDLDSELDEDGLALLRSELDDYPGVVVFTSATPERVCAEYRRWDVDGHPTAGDAPPDAPRDAQPAPPQRPPAVTGSRL